MGTSVIKKYLVLSLLVVYLVIALAYLFYLPKYNPLRTANNYIRIKTHQVLNPTHHMEHSTANILVLWHQVYKSTIENKREVLNGRSGESLISVLLIFGAISLFYLLRRSGGHFKTYQHSQQYAYLSYCSLRI